MKLWWDVQVSWAPDHATRSARAERECDIAGLIVRATNRYGHLPGFQVDVTRCERNGVFVKTYPRNEQVDRVNRIDDVRALLKTLSAPRPRSTTNA